MRILILLVLAAVMTVETNAAELKELLENKTAVYKGSCNVTKDGVLTFKKEETVASIPCIVGMELPDETKHYVLFYYNNMPAKLVVYDEKTKTQVTLWVGQSI